MSQVNKKLKNEDIKKMKGISVVGYIRHNSEKTDTVVYDSHVHRCPVNNLIPEVSLEYYELEFLFIHTLI